MILSSAETLIIIAMVALGTMITRFLPFALFPANKETHPYIVYLGKVLPYSAIGMLIIYCLKEVNITNPSTSLPEAVSILLIILIHRWKNNPLLSIGAGTAIYMFIVQLIGR